jgi:predicted Zn-dependent protease
MSRAAGPLTRKTPIPPPAADAQAAMVVGGLLTTSLMTADPIIALRGDKPSPLAGEGEVVETDYAHTFNEALDAIEAEDFADARVLLEIVAEADPRDGEAVLMLARIEREAGDVEMARGHLESLVELAPNHVDGRVELADLLLEAGETGPAVSHLRAVLVERPNHWEALLLMGNAFTDAEAHDEASAAYQQCLESNPFSGDAWYNLATAQEATGNLPAAVAAYAGYLQVRPEAEDLAEVTAHMALLEAES